MRNSMEHDQHNQIPLAGTNPQTEEHLDPDDVQRQLHLWNRAAGGVARTLGVQVQAACGTWVWTDEGPTLVLRRVSDLRSASDSARRCRRCVLALEMENGL